MRAVEHPVGAEEVMAYLDGEIAGTRARVVEGHLKTCERCQDIASRLRSLSSELSAWEVAGALPLGAPQGVPAAPRRERWWRTAQVSRFAASAVLTVVTAVVTVITVLWVAFADLRNSRMMSYPPDHELAAAASNLERDRAYLAESLRSEGAAQATEPRQIVRTASLTLIVADFGAVRPAVHRVVQDVGGFLGQVQVNNFEEGGQTMTAILRVPASRLEEAIGALKALGRATRESQSGDDVGEEVTDLDVRLANARNTEARLGDLMRNRTGNVTQVLEVEREIGRVRGEIERMAARREELAQRITYATLNLNVSVQRQASLSTGPVPVATELRNAFVEGLRYAYESALLAVAVILSAAPVVLLWTVLLWFPVRAVLRARRARRA